MKQFIHLGGQVPRGAQKVGGAGSQLQRWQLWEGVKFYVKGLKA